MWKGARARLRLAGEISPDRSRDMADQVRQHARLWFGLAALPESLRAVVTLRIMEGLSGNEVKDLLGYSASQVSRMLHEGLEQLRNVLTDRGVDNAKEDACHEM